MWLKVDARVRTLLDCREQPRYRADSGRPGSGNNRTGKDGEDLVVLGSGALVQSLMRRNLVDEFVLTIHPLVLGSGRRLLPDGGPSAALRLVETTTTTTGVVIAVYQPAEPAT